MAGELGNLQPVTTRQAFNERFRFTYPTYRQWYVGGPGQPQWGPMSPSFGGGGQGMAWGAYPSLGMPPAPMPALPPQAQPPQWAPPAAQPAPAAPITASQPRRSALFGMWNPSKGGLVGYTPGG